MKFFLLFHTFSFIIIKLCKFIKSIHVYIYMLFTIRIKIADNIENLREGTFVVCLTFPN